MSARDLTLVEAVNEALHVEMGRDERVMVLGEDVGVLGGAFRATEGLQKRFGAERCVDTPLAEAGIVGTAVGLAMAGWRPVCELQFDGSCYPALDQVICHLGRYRWRSGGRMEFPIVVRLPYGGGVGAPELHEDSPEAYFAHAPGVKVVIPATPADAKGLLAAAIRDPDPVIMLEPKRLYRSVRDHVPDDEHVVALGRAVVARPGDRITLIAYGAMRPTTLDVADRLAAEGVDAEVIDVRTLFPLDTVTILASVRKTGRAVIVHEAPRTAGFGAEVAAVIAEHALDWLRAPVMRVTGHDVPAPYPALAHVQIPDVDRVYEAAQRALAH